MRLELTGRHVEITPALRGLVDTKLARLERMLKDAAVSAQVVLTRERHNRRADVTLHARGEKFLHGVGAGTAWAASMTQAVDKIVQQAQRVKGKWQERKRRAVRSAAALPEAAPATERASPAPRAPRGSRLRMPSILRASRQTIKPMSIAEAVRQAEANGEGIVVFRDNETSAISVVFRGLTGELALVQTEA